MERNAGQLCNVSSQSERFNLESAMFVLEAMVSIIPAAKVVIAVVI